MVSKPERVPLGVALAEARRAAGITQRELARRLGRVHSFVARVEAGDRRVDVGEFLELANALGFDACAMIRDLNVTHSKVKG